MTRLRCECDRSDRVSRSLLRASLLYDAGNAHLIDADSSEVIHTRERDADEIYCIDAHAFTLNSSPSWCSMSRISE